MSMPIEVESSTKTEQLIASLGWTTKPSGNGDNVAVEVCPLCANSNYKFFIHIGGDKDGLWRCVVCEESGNIFQLRERLGVRTSGVTSVRELLPGTPSPLPNADLLHKRLMTEEKFGDALDYLVAERGFSIDTIAKLKIGAEEFNSKIWVVFPYLDAAGKTVFFKARTVPPQKKEFRGPSGREAMLYNDVVLRPGMDELVMVEGEADCISLLNQGIRDAVGIPGAGIKKAAWLEKLDRLAPKAIYLCYDTDKVGQTAARDMAARIGLDKVRNLLLPPFTTALGKPGKDVNEFFAAGHTLKEFEALKASARPFDVEGVQSIGDVLDELIDTLEQKGTEPTYLTPWPSLTRCLGGLEDGDVVGVMAEGKVGKAQPLSSLVRTTEKWKKMGDIHVGDLLASEDGEPSEVTGLFARGELPVYEVVFSDGRSTRCCDDHLWKVGSATNFGRDGWRVIDTTDLKKLVEHNTDRWFIPLHSGVLTTAPVRWDGKPILPLLMDPWLLGVLIGDGTLTDETPRISKLDGDLRESVDAVVSKHGYRTTDRPDGFCIANTGANQQSNLFSHWLSCLGLKGKDCYSKFIPSAYLEAGFEDRLRLLQGLMDTDGTAAETGATSYSTSSQRLAENVQYLVRSLGGVSSVSKRTPTYTYKGETLEGATAYQVTVQLHDRERVFTLPRKKERVLGRATAKQNRLTVVSVTLVGYEPVRCISVSHPSKLYITDNFIVTHNTTMGLDWVQWAAERGTGGMLYCLEMLPVRLGRKWVSHSTQTDDTPGASKLTPEVVRTAKVLASQMPADLLLGYGKSRRPEDVCETIKQAVRRYGIKLVCLDNLQLLCHSVKESAQETSKVMKQIKALAMELKIVILLIIQPNRVAEGQIIAARNAMGSSAIEKDVDSMICLHRNRVAQIRAADFHGFLETSENFEPQMLVRVDLSRYSAGGACTLLIEGATSTIRELNRDELMGAVTARPTGEIPTEAEAI